MNWNQAPVGHRIETAIAIQSADCGLRVIIIGQPITGQGAGTNRNSGTGHLISFNLINRSDFFFVFS